MDNAPHRPTSRVLLADEHDRLLFFLDGLADREWLTPGGGVDPGESVEQAAVRELREETGLVVPVEDLGPLVATTSGLYLSQWDGVVRRATDHFFFVRTSHFEPDLSGFTESERQTVHDLRWWPAAELLDPPANLVPWGLPAILPDLLAGRFPAEPVALPWHHPGTETNRAG